MYINIGIYFSIQELYSILRKNMPLNLEMVRRHLFSNHVLLFHHLHGAQFARGLPPVWIIQKIAVSRVLKRAIAQDGVSKDEVGEEYHDALESIWRNGWLHAHGSNPEDTIYLFASPLHRWLVHASSPLYINYLSNYFSRYCSFLLQEGPNLAAGVDYASLIELVVDAIKEFRPRQLSEPLRSTTGNARPLEDQYQKEIYRCLYTLLEGKVRISPEFVVKNWFARGTIDFFLAQKRWGVELLRHGDHLAQHMNRFKPGGAYYHLIESGLMEQYIVVDFAKSRPKKSHPGILPSIPTSLSLHDWLT